MVGNKHKNGIVCTFPHCNKTMRTQKFKMHFMRAHLRDGEDYSVEHRRQYEVAREETARQFKPHSGSITASPVLLPMGTTTMLREEAVSGLKTSTLNSTGAPVGEEAPTLHSKQGAASVKQSQQLPLPIQAEVVDVKQEERCVPSSTKTTGSCLPVNGQSLPSGEQARGSKRSASAMELSAESVDPASTLLMQFIALMDQRFQELVGKMGEMIDVQKELIDTLQASNPHGQAPASAFSHAIDVVMKRRKENTKPFDKENAGKDFTARSPSDTDANGHSSSGFEL
uniref:C2H2-type domain-containing protein n=1 Tax=Peronospora matthiolae TaxID=2874970 RepID=A0AAV1VIJ1_9STRA